MRIHMPHKQRLFCNAYPILPNDRGCYLFRSDDSTWMSLKKKSDVFPNDNYYDNPFTKHRSIVSNDKKEISYL